MFFRAGVLNYIRSQVSDDQIHITKSSLRAKYYLFFYALLYVLQFLRGQLIFASGPDLACRPALENPGFRALCVKNKYLQRQNNG